MRRRIDRAAESGAFICQSHSLTIWMQNPTYKALTSMHFYVWNAGLKPVILDLRGSADPSGERA